MKFSGKNSILPQQMTEKISLKWVKILNQGYNQSQV